MCTDIELEGQALRQISIDLILTSEMEQKVLVFVSRASGAEQANF